MPVAKGATYNPALYCPRPLSFDAQEARRDRLQRAADEPVLVDRWTTEAQRSFTPQDTAERVVEAAGTFDEVDEVKPAPVHYDVTAHVPEVELRAPFERYHVESKNAYITRKTRQPKDAVRTPRPRQALRPMSTAIGSPARIAAALDREHRAHVPSLPQHLIVPPREAQRSAAVAAGTTSPPRRSIRRPRSASAGATTHNGMQPDAARERHGAIKRAAATSTYTQYSRRTVSTQTDVPSGNAILGEQIVTVVTTSLCTCTRCGRVFRKSPAVHFECDCGAGKADLVQLLAPTADNYAQIGEPQHPRPHISPNRQPGSCFGVPAARSASAGLRPSTPYDARPRVDAGSEPARSYPVPQVSLSEFAAGESEIVRGRSSSVGRGYRHLGGGGDATNVKRCLHWMK